MILLRQKEYLLPNREILFCLRHPAFLKAGAVNNRAEIARLYGPSRGRVSQIMSLLHPPDEIQQSAIALPPQAQRLYFGRRLRQILAVPKGKAQAKAFEGLVKRLSGRAGPRSRKGDGSQVIDTTIGGLWT